MDEIPDDILIEILAYLPTRSFLPTAHVSKRFRNVYRSHNYKTNPLQVGNLFDSHWNQTIHHHPTLRTSLFEYYLENGWTHPSNHKNFIKGIPDDSTIEASNTNNPLLKQVMFGAAARGDITGMSYLFKHHDHHHHYHLFYHDFKQDPDICTIAGAAGRLEALKWLICVQKCKWNPAEVCREASENLHTDVIMFIEQMCYEHRRKGYRDDAMVNAANNVDRMEVLMPYGEGMPW